MNMIQVTKIVKVGSSMGIIVPKNVLRAFDWKRGDRIYFGYAPQETLTINKVDESRVKQLFANQDKKTGEGIIQN